MLTGGAGDLGTQLSPILESAGHEVVILDPLQPQSNCFRYMEGSLLDPNTLKSSLQGVDQVIHIAGWHGIHEGIRTQQEFQQLNVEGTRLLTRFWQEQHFQDLIFISSSSVHKQDSHYGQTKREAEALVKQVAQEHDLKAITLRPRGFIPPWNTKIYDSFADWARYFYTGAVHIDDVVQAVLLALKTIPEMSSGGASAFMVDRKPDFSELELKAWDTAGPGSTFAARFPEYSSLAKYAKLPVQEKPRYYDISQTQASLGYQPTYGLADMLVELDRQA